MYTRTRWFAQQSLIFVQAFLRRCKVTANQADKQSKIKKLFLISIGLTKSKGSAHYPHIEVARYRFPGSRLARLISSRSKSKSVTCASFSWVRCTI